MIVKDSVGAVLNIGDRIAYLGRGTRSLEPATVESFSKSGGSVRCHQHEINQYGDWVPQFYTTTEGDTPWLITRPVAYVVKVAA